MDRCIPLASPTVGPLRFLSPGYSAPPQAQTIDAMLLALLAQTVLRLASWHWPTFSEVVVPQILLVYGQGILHRCIVILPTFLIPQILAWADHQVVEVLVIFFLPLYKSEFVRRQVLKPHTIPSIVFLGMPFFAQFLLGGSSPPSIIKVRLVLFVFADHFYW